VPNAPPQELASSFIVWRRGSLPLALLSLLALIAVPGTLPAARSHAGRDQVFDQIDAIVQTLSEISGLAEKHRVPYGRMTKEQLRKFLTKRIRKTLKPDEIHADELSLKMFGLVPQDFDLKTSTVDLLTEQAAAFYDYDAKKLVLMDATSLSAETETLAHELGHALADQHFHLEKYMNDSNADDDADLARTAVVEGQASWLMFAYSLKINGQNPEPTQKMLNDAFGGDSGSAAQYPVLKSSPLYIQQSLLFPYSEGTLFFDAVYRKEGKRAFSTVFTDPPVDSAQIIHPNRYFSRTKATSPALPALSIFGNEKAISEGDVGEFDHKILLWQYLDQQQAKDVAPHLRGGRFKIAGGKNQTPVLLYASEWDSPEEAALFFADYKRVLQKKWKICKVSTSTDNLFSGQGDDGYFVTRLNGSVVTSVEGMANVNDRNQLTAATHGPLSAKVQFAAKAAMR
jgi:hypothetical protein